MSKLKLQSHASGSGVFTLSSPNSNTDRTITLPDGTGTLAFTTGDDDKLALSGGTMTGGLAINKTGDGALVITSTGGGSTVDIISTSSTATDAPELKLYKNSSSPAANDQIGYLAWHSNDNAGNELAYASMYTNIDDVTNGSEDGSMHFKVKVAGANAERLALTATGATITGGASIDGAVVINESGGDWDFRVESDHNANMLFVQGEYNSVGIGVSPKVSGNNDTDYTSLQIGGNGNIYAHTPASNGHAIVIAQNVYNGSTNKYIVTDEASRYYQSGGIHVFNAAVSGSANAAITWVECLKVWKNPSSGPGFTVGGAWNTNGSDKLYSCHVENNIIGHRNVAKLTDAQTHWRFFNPNGSVGTIVTSGSGTSYNTSSDYRLKENVNYTWDATTRLKQLKPARFNFIADDTNTLVDGFIAHEAATVVPECVVGTKDAMMDEVYEVTAAVMDGDTVVTEAVMGTRSVPDMQGIDQSKLVPLLVKTIQELEARITALEA